VEAAMSIVVLRDEPDKATVVVSHLVAECVVLLTEPLSVELTPEEARAVAKQLLAEADACEREISAVW
jgi:uncharacterized protein YjeT (DUF2065 family)